MGIHVSASPAEAGSGRLLPHHGAQRRVCWVLLEVLLQKRLTHSCHTNALLNEGGWKSPICMVFHGSQSLIILDSSGHEVEHLVWTLRLGEVNDLT